jgi:hypothetical protein
LLRSQDTFFVLKSNRHQVTHFISKLQSHRNSVLFFFFLLQMHKNCKFDKNSTNALILAMKKKDYSSIANCRKKIPHSLWSYLVFLAAIQNFCVFIPRLLQESLDVYCRTLAGKRCLRIREEVSNSI